MPFIRSKGMSGQYSTKGTPAAPPVKKKGSLASNGNGPPPLTYADPEDDENMNEIHDENVELTVFLPDGSSSKQSIESNIPMMDLLVNLAAKSRLNPASHSLVVLSDDKWKQIDFKANKTIGLLAGEDRLLSVQIVPKKTEEKVKTRPANTPFEMTYRFTVNLPHNQKKVLRISPKLSLGEVREIVCREKGFDPSRYVFQLPGNPESLSDQVIVGDLKTSEINFTTTALIDSSIKSMPDLNRAPGLTSSSSLRSNPETAYMPMAGEKKSKRGFLSFLSKKDKKFKLDNTTDLESASFNRKNNSAGMRGKDYEQHARPKSMYVGAPTDLQPVEMRRTIADTRTAPEARTDFRRSTGSSLTTVRESSSKAPVHDSIPENPPASSSSKKAGKKRVAPPPPKQIDSTPKPVQVEIKVEPQKTEISRIEDVTDGKVPVTKTNKLHSRNSSDSSGYHELTLSGAESPDGVKVIETFKTSLDSASIDSGDHFNADSGVRDLSPSRRRIQEEASPRGKETSEGPVAPGRKKKRAPPPPGASASTINVQKQETENLSKDDDDEALLAMEVVAMEFDRITEDDNMRMIEDESIRSEDIDIDVEKEKSRPPQFIAPPPPTEPPPPESEPVDFDAVMNHVNTIDIGVGDDTTSIGPSSTKSSPVSIPRRPDSRSSTSSVNTLEDLSLAFRQTIAMGEEALESENFNDNVEDELKASMPEFKDKISKLSSETGEDTQSGNTTGRSQASELGTDSDASFVVKDSPVAMETGSTVISSEAGEQSTGRDSPVRTTVADRESAEITYEFTVDTVPPEFQTHGEEGDAEHKAEEDEDEVERYEEEIRTFTIRPGSMEIGSPRRIPDLDSPKEHRTFSLQTREVFSDIPVDESTPKESVQISRRDPEPEKEVSKPPEKDEFIISLDDLNNIDFSIGYKSDKKKDKSAEIADTKSLRHKLDFQDTEEIEVSESVQRSSYDGSIDSDNENRDVKNKCSELSFSPNSEEEMEHVMEEKSISLIAHPIERTPIKSSETSEISFETEQPVYSSSTKIVLAGSNDVNDVEQSPRPDATQSEENTDTQNLTQAQYQQLQQQFLMWQNQLAQNQRLLANQTPTNQITGAGPGPTNDDQSQQLQQLNMQIQLQQQMLMQLQQSMQQLTMQSTISPQVQPQVQAVNQPEILSQPTGAPLQGPVVTKSVSPPPVQEIPAPPPPPAPEAAKPKVVKADAKYNKPKTKRHETKLDPREQLMLDIRNYKGRTGLKKVPVKATHWHNA